MKLLYILLFLNHNYDIIIIVRDSLKWLDHAQKSTLMADLEETLQDISYIITVNEPNTTKPITLPDPR